MPDVLTYLRRLRIGEAVAGAAGLVLLVDMFLSWYRIGDRIPRAIAEQISRQSGLGGHITANAWQAFAATDLLLLLCAATAIGLALLTMTQRTPALPVAGSVAVTFVGAMSTVLVLYRLIDQPGPDKLIDIRYGAVVGLIASAAVTAGGWLAMRDESPALSAAESPPEPRIEPAPPPAGG